MRALVCGGRDYRDREQAFSCLDQLHAKYKFTEIIAGAAAGVSSFGFGKREAWIGAAIVAVVGWGVINCLILLVMWLWKHTNFSFV